MCARFASSSVFRKHHITWLWPAYNKVQCNAVPCRVVQLRCHVYIHNAVIAITFLNSSVQNAQNNPMCIVRYFEMYSHVHSWLVASFGSNTRTNKWRSKNYLFIFVSVCVCLCCVLGFTALCVERICTFWWMHFYERFILFFDILFFRCLFLRFVFILQFAVCISIKSHGKHWTTRDMTTINPPVWSV